MVSIPSEQSGTPASQAEVDAGDLELLTGRQYGEKAAEIAEYQQVLTRLRALAANQKTSRANHRQGLEGGRTIVPEAA